MDDPLNTITRGCTFSFELRLMDEGGNAVPFLADDIVTLSVKKTLRDTAYAFQVKAAISGGIAEIRGEPQLTKHLPVGVYIRDVQFNRANGDVIPLKSAGQFNIQEKVNHD